MRFIFSQVSTEPAAAAAALVCQGSGRAAHTVELPKQQIPIPIFSIINNIHPSNNPHQKKGGWE